MDEMQINSKNSLVHIILNRPNALNALSFEMLKNLYQALTNFADDEKVNAIVVTSSSAKAFCAGGDVKWIFEAKNNNLKTQLEFFTHEYKLNGYIGSYQ